MTILTFHKGHTKYVYMCSPFTLILAKGHVTLLLGIPRRECLMVLSEFFIFLFFRRQGFWMITFDRQAGPLQNFNRSHVMVIGRSVSFSDPAPQTPQNPPPPPIFFFACVSEPQEHF